MKSYNKAHPYLNDSYLNKKCSYNLIESHLSKDTITIMKILLPFKNKKIQITIESTNSGHKLFNITGTLVYVDNTILKLCLKSKSEGSTKECIYSLESLLGFTVLNDEKPIEDKKKQHHLINCCDKAYNPYKCSCFTKKDFFNLIDYYSTKDTIAIMKNLLPFKNKKIQIITEATPPAGRPPNISGTLLYVDDKIIKLRLKSESEGSTKEGIYLLKSLLGFIPLAEEESGCEKEKNPLSSILSESLGKRVKLLVASNSSPSAETDIIGTILDVTNDFVKIQLDQTTATTNPLISTYPLTQVVGVTELTSSKTPKGKGYKGKGSKDKGSKDSHSPKSEITVQVTVNWVGDASHPDEVNINFIREDVITSIPTINGVSTFTTKPTGDLIIQGESIPGFTIPVKEIKITPKLPFVYETLTYTATTIPVTNITLTPPTLSLLPTDTFKLTATIIPLNASNQEVLWQSDNPSVADVDSTGVVTANTEGISIITVKTVDGSYTATTIVTVTNIQSIIDPPPISAIPGEIVVLPVNVNTLLSNSSILSLPVNWEYNETLVGSTFIIPSTSPLTSYILKGILSQTELTPSLIINVDISAPVAIPVTGLNLNTISTSIYVGSTVTIQPIIVPDNATTKDVLWSSSDNSIATVNNGTVIGISPGTAIITATTVDGGFKAYCQISVSSVPEIDLIYSVKTVYTTREEVVINVENLVASRVQSPTLYYIKVEQIGSSPLLGSGTINLTEDMTEFNLYAFTNFNLADNYNNEYFVFMSTDPTFPKSDEQTLSTNFKIETAVPTVPTENIKVDLSIIGGPLDNLPENIIFILAREIDIPIENITWRDYAINPDAPDDEKQFTDEVKLKGKTNSEGIVIWETPKEPLKLGGYVLLEVTPDGYIDNLNLINSESSDGDLIKVINLTRDGIIIRHIINTFID